MASITLKNLPLNLHRALKTRASENKRSLNQEVIALLEQSVSPARRVNVEKMIEESRRFRASLKFTTTPEEIDAFKRQGRE